MLPKMKMKILHIRKIKVRASSIVLKINKEVHKIWKEPNCTHKAVSSSLWMVRGNSTLPGPTEKMEELSRLTESKITNQMDQFKSANLMMMANKLKLKSLWQANQKKNNFYDYFNELTFNLNNLHFCFLNFELKFFIKLRSWKRKLWRKTIKNLFILIYFS